MATRPSKLPRWATTGIKVEPTEDKKDQGSLTSEKPPAQYDNWFKDLTSRWLDFFNATIGLEVFGDGSDGDAVLDGINTYPGVVTLVGFGADYALARDAYFDDLTLSAGVTLNTSGFRLFVKGTCTNPATAHIFNDGADGQNASGGGAGGAGAFAGTLFGGGAGGKANGSSSAGDAGVASTHSGGGSGGRGGTFSGNAGGAGGLASNAPVDGGYRSLFAVLNGYRIGIATGAPALNQIAGGGGGGGAGVGGGGGSQGGGGGGGGGCMVGAIRELINNGAISVNGGKGGNGDGGTGRAAGGGGGGFMGFVVGSMSGSGTMTATGGQPGTNTVGSPAALAGSDGHVVLYDLSDGAGSVLGEHKESGVGTMTSSGSGDGVDYLDVVFDAAFADTSYEFSFSAYNSAGSVTPLTLVIKNTTMMRIKPTAPFDGEISWSVAKQG